MSNGWYGDGTYFRQVNCVDGIWFGFRVSKRDNGNLYYIALYIDSNAFGWMESYNVDGSIDTDLTGYYLNDIKI